MYLDTPKLRVAVFYFIMAALCAAIAWKGDRLPDWLRLFLAFCAIIFGSAGLVNAVNFIAFASAERIKEIRQALVEGVLSLSLALKGLTTLQTEIVLRHDVTNIIALLGEDDIFWTIRAPGGDIPWGFVADFIEKSQETVPYLWPIRKHDALSWPDSERLCTLVTDLIIHRGWAEKTGGPFAAKLITSLEYVAEKFRVEL